MINIIKGFAQILKAYNIGMFFPKRSTYYVSVQSKISLEKTYYDINGNRIDRTLNYGLPNEHKPVILQYIRKLQRELANWPKIFTIKAYCIIFIQGEVLSNLLRTGKSAGIENSIEKEFNILQNKRLN